MGGCKAEYQVGQVAWLNYSASERHGTPRRSNRHPLPTNHLPLFRPKKI